MLNSSHLLGLVCSNFLLEIVKSERFEPRNHFIIRWSMIILVGVVLNRTTPTVDNSPIQDYALTPGLSCSTCLCKCKVIILSDCFSCKKDQL